MADTIDDITLNGTDWQDAFDLTGIPVLTSIFIQNKTASRIFIYIKTTKPTSDFDQGYSLDVGADFTVIAGENGCWLYGNGPVHIRSLA